MQSADRAEAPPANPVEPAGTPPPSGMTTLAVGVVVVAALYLAREVLIPISLAVLLSFVLAPLVGLLRRWRLPRIPAVIVTVLVALGIILGLAAVIGSQVAQLATDFPRYQATITRKVEGLETSTIGRMGEYLKRFNREINRPGDDAAKDGPVPGATAPEDLDRKPVPVELREREPSPLELAERVLAPVLKPLATTFIVFVVAIFILMQQEDLRDRMIRLFGSSDLHRTTKAIDDAVKRLSRYFLIQLALNSGFGVMIAIGLWAIGVPSPVLWGIFAALMRFVPYIGSILAGFFPVVLAAAVDPGWSMALWTAALFLITEPLMGHGIEPMVYGHSTGLSPAAVVISAVFWTWIWGPIGLILATPLTLCLVVLGRHVERLEFLDVIFGDRPALTPVENFYQRMLAGDPDEALEQAETLLKERPLSAYYDEVALKGLQLAANDADRGVLDERQLGRIKEAIRALVQDLRDHRDESPAGDARAESDAAGPTAAEQAVGSREPVRTPPPDPDDLAPAWQVRHPVLCIAGRGALDEAASEMLAQLLSKHGLGSRVLPHAAVSRANVGSLEVREVAMICISYLEISGSPAHLRYLIRRLRQKAPEARILVGLWPAEDAILTDEALRAMIGADDYVTSLRQAVQACLDAAHAAAEAPAPAKPKARVLEPAARG